MIPEHFLIEWTAARLADPKFFIFRSPTTGNIFHSLDTMHFSRVEEVIYIHHIYDDSILETNPEKRLATALANSINTIREANIIFVDPFHTYEDSFMALEFIVTQAKPECFIFVHDCNPKTAIAASPEYTKEIWMGVTYAAFLDVAQKHQKSLITINDRTGLGVFLPLGFDAEGKLVPDLKGWASRDKENSYPYFRKHHKRLLNLISPQKFAYLLCHAKTDFFTFPSKSCYWRMLSQIYAINIKYFYYRCRTWHWTLFKN
jgi:hypothetical protein